MRVTYKVTGLKEMDAALSEFAKATAKGIANRALKRAAQPILDRAIELVPKKDHYLERGLHITTKKPKGHASKAAYAAAMKAGATKAEAGRAQRAYNRENPGSFAEVFVATGNQPHAHLQEFGTEHHPAHPYMRPAMEEKAEEAIGLIADELGREIEKAAARARRKALRQAAKG